MTYHICKLNGLLLFPMMICFVFLKSACFIPLAQMNSKEWSRKVVKITQK